MTTTEWMLVTSIVIQAVTLLGVLCLWASVQRALRRTQPKGRVSPMRSPLHPHITPYEGPVWKSKTKKVTKYHSDGEASGR